MPLIDGVPLHRAPRMLVMFAGNLNTGPGLRQRWSGAMRTMLGILLGAVIACASALKAEVALDGAAGTSCSAVVLNSGSIQWTLAGEYICAWTQLRMPF